MSDRIKIYVASSWRNGIQPEVVKYLRTFQGFDVYDFKNPKEGDVGFSWSQIDPEWEGWDFEGYTQGLQHSLAEEGFASDWEAMTSSDVCVLVLPCGRSAHIEAGYFVGANKSLIIYIPKNCMIEPELMYKMAGSVNITDRLTSIPGLITRVLR